jgi:hypothetical protein
MESYWALRKGRDTRANHIITESSIIEWLSGLADRGQLTAKTINTYRSAMSTYYTEHHSGVNPAQSPLVSRAISGIERARGEVEQRHQKEKSEAVTMDMIRQIISKHHSTTDSFTIMRIAAAALATAAAMRPSELLGSSTNDRHLTTSQIKFFTTDESDEPIPADKYRHDTFTSGSAPARVSIQLLISKTNQNRKPQFIHVSNPATVAALWRWRIIRPADRSDDNSEKDYFFKASGYRPLQAKALVKWITKELASFGHRLHLTPKCFRIGGASSALASGASIDDIKATGRWKSDAWQLYPNEASRKLRALSANRKL